MTFELIKETINVRSHDSALIGPITSYRCEKVCDIS